MKKIFRIAVVLSIVMAFCVACEKKLPKIEKVDIVENIAENINDAISKAILLKNEGKYGDGQYLAESHENLLIENVTENYREEEGKKFIRVYSIVSIGRYNFEKGEYVRVSGSEIIPTILTFEKTSEGTINLINYQVPNEKKNYEKEIRNMFPQELQEEVLNINDELKQELLKEEVKFLD